MTLLNPRQEIVSLLRGYFACPLISFLGKRGVLNKMIGREFSINDFDEISNNKEVFRSILVYFESIGIVKKCTGEDKYCSTEVGEKIFKRYGAFCLLHSYGSFLNLLEKLLFDKTYKEKPTVDREENIIGSGQINGKKYFPAAIEMMKRKKNIFKIIDIGCGNGAFLNLVLDNFPDCRISAVDISTKAVKETENRLRKANQRIVLNAILSDARDVSYWLPKCIEEGYNKGKGSFVISMWYCIHEISKRDKKEIVNFLNEIHKIAPFAEIIIGEITRASAEVLLENKYGSIMPEFLFFHEISGREF